MRSGTHGGIGFDGKVNMAPHGSEVQICSSIRSIEVDDDKETRGANPNPEARKSREHVASIVSSSAQPRPQGHGWLPHGLRGMLRYKGIATSLMTKVICAAQRFSPNGCVWILFVSQQSLFYVVAKEVHVLKDIDFLFLEIEHHIFVKQCQFNERSMSSYVYCCMVMTEEQLDEWNMWLTRTTGSVAKTRSPGSLNAGAQDLET